MRDGVPYKLAHEVSGQWAEFSFPPVFERHTTSSGMERIIFGVPGGDVEVIRSLLRCMEPPIDLMYILHTPRGEGSPGRYQSPPLATQSVDAFLAKYAEYLRADGRFDLWLHSAGSNGTVVFDRHNRGFAYGPVDCFAQALSALGFGVGELRPVPRHQHYYRAEYDVQAAALLGEYAWQRTDLRPEDEQ